MSALSLCGLTVSVDAKYSNPSALALSAVADGIDERAVLVRTDGERGREVFEPVRPCPLRGRAEAQLKTLAAPCAALRLAFKSARRRQKRLVVVLLDDAAYLGMRLGEISSLLRGALEVFFFGKDVGIEIEHGQLERVVQHFYAMGTARRAATVQQQPRSPPLLFESLDLGVAELGIIYDVQNAFSNNSVI